MSTLDPKIFGEVHPDIANLMTDPALFYKVKTELDKFIVGEDQAKLLLFIIGASSYTDWNLSAIINASSSAGKSWLKNHVLKYFGNVETYSRLTSAAPDRLGRDFTKKILDIEELRGTEGAQSTLRVWISEGNLKLLTTAPDEENGKLRTETIETKGSPTFITTCTNPEIDDELLNRVFIISLDETREQTRKVIEFEAKRYCKLGTHDEEETPNELFKAAICQLTFIDRVLIPYADDLAKEFPIPKGGELTVGPRRDFKKLIFLIGTVAWLHQAQRQIVAPDTGPPGAPKPHPLQKFVVASPLDFYVVWKICKSGFLRTLFKLSERHKKVLDCFSPTNLKTVKEVADEIGLSENRTREFLNSLVQKGYLGLDRSEKTYKYSLKQKVELEGTIEQFVASLKSFEQNKLKKWLEAGKYIILSDPTAPATFIDPLTGLPESELERIISNIQKEPEEDTKTETKPLDSMNSPTEPPTSCFLCTNFLPRDGRNTTIYQGKTVHLECFLETIRGRKDTEESSTLQFEGN